MLTGRFWNGMGSGPKPLHICESCAEINFSGIHEAGSSLQIFEEQHCGLESLISLDLSAQECRCCAFLYREMQSAIRRAKDRSSVFDKGESHAEIQRQLQDEALILSVTPSKATIDSLTPVQRFLQPRLSFANDRFEDWLYSAVMRIATPGCPTTTHTSFEDDLESISGFESKELTSVYRCNVVEGELTALSASTVILPWYRKCLTEHTECPPSKQSPLPDRVLHVGTVESPILRLLETNNVIGNCIALSYCWGIVPQTVTLTANIETFQICIDEFALPSTIQDAIAVTRALGVSYLWVDALCIIQDSATDWDVQSAKMASVYGNAYLTLCISRASSVHDGFLKPRLDTTLPVGYTHEKNGMSHEVFLVPDRISHHDILEDLSDTPLGARGWCFQERLVSLRKVYFHEQQLIWECCSRFYFETGVEALAMKAELANTVAPMRPNQNKGPFVIDVGGWNGVIESYMACKLTRNTDRLPALSAIAETFSQQLKQVEVEGGVIEPAVYIAGHWRTHFVSSSTWRTVGERKRNDASRPTQDDYVAPSWSWASAVQPVKFNGIVRATRELWSDLEYCVQPAGTGTFGMVEKGAWISLKAPLIEASCKFAWNFELDERDLELVFADGSGFCKWTHVVDGQDSGVYLDQAGEYERVFVAVLQSNGLRFRTWNGLLLEKEGRDFKRVGTFWRCELNMDDDEVDSDDEEADLQVIGEMSHIKVY